MPADVPSLSIFPTNLGWFGLLGRNARLVAVIAGHGSAVEVRRAAGVAANEPTGTPQFREAEWNRELKQRLERYCLGDRVDFDDVLLELPRGTTFQARVLKIVRAS